MEFKPIMPEVDTKPQYSSGSSPSSSSSSSSSSSVYSEDSDNEVAANSVSARDVTLSDGESENGGFVSGAEEFETAPEAPMMTDDAGTEIGEGEKPVVGLGDGSGLPPGAFRPVAKVSNDDDEEVEEEEDDVVVDGYVGGSKAKVLMEDSEEAKGVFARKKLKELIELLDASGGSVDENSASGKGSITNGTLGGPDKSSSSEVEVNSATETTQVDKLKDEEEKPVFPKVSVDNNLAETQLNPEVIEQVDEKLSEVERTNLADGGGQEVIQENQSGSETAAFEDAVEGKDSEIVDREIPVEERVSLNNGLELVSENAVERAALTSPGSKNNEDIDESEEVVNGLQKDDLDVMGKEAEEGPMASTDASDGENGTGGPVVDEEDKRGIEVKHEAGFGAEEDVPAVEAVAIAPESNGTIVESQERSVEDEMPSETESSKQGVEVDLEDAENLQVDEDAGSEGSETDGEKEDLLFENSEAAKQLFDELERGLGAGSQSGAENSLGNSQHVDGQIVTDSDEEVDTDEEGDGKQLFDSAALAALLKAATGANNDGGNITITSQDGSKLFSVERPAGLGSSLRSVKPAPRQNRPGLFSSSLAPSVEAESNLSEEEKKKLEKIQEIRVRFLRLVQRLGYSPEDSLAAQVLYRLAIVVGRRTSQLFNLESAKRIAAELESKGKDDLGFSLNVLVIGKAGVGKSAAINSILGEDKAQIHAFETATIEVKEIVGTVHGVKVRFFDTPALKPSIMEQNTNRKILSYIKKFTKKCPPDIVLYVDRLDTQTRDLNDLPLLKTVTGALGSSIWKSAVVTLTHGASAPPDTPSGSPMNYDAFVTQRSHIVQQSIGQAVGDLRLMNPSLMNPVSLVENHLSCRKNREGEKILPNGQAWRPQLLLLSFSMKILSEASSLSKPQDPFDQRKLFGFRMRAPPLPYLLSWLLQSRTHPKVTSDQGVENGDSDVDVADLSESDEEDEENEYDQLPPFKPLRKAQLAKLSKDQRRAYLEEYDYRVKLLQGKQWREELKRLREMKKGGKVPADEFMGEDADTDADNGSPAAVPVPLHDMVLPPSFDSDNPAYRYRFLEPTSQFVARPVLDTHGWDHDCGYDGVNLEHSLAIAGKFPTAVAIQMTKDKKEFNIHLDSSVAAKYGESGSAMAGFDIQNIGKQLAYIVRGETKFKSFRKNKTAAGVSVTLLGENVSAGLKVEDQITLGKRVVFVGSAGTVRSQGDSVYGANLEVTLKEADFPIGQDQSSLGLSLVRWRGDLALGANFQSQFSVGRSSKIAVRAGLNNKMSGQISVRTSSAEQLQLALVGIVPIATAIYRSLWPGVSDNYSIY